MSLDLDYFNSVLYTVKAKLDASGINLVTALPSDNWYELRVERHGQHGSRHCSQGSFRYCLSASASELAEQFFEEATNVLGNVDATKWAQ
jgi:hypothetical protein